MIALQPFAGEQYRKRTAISSTGNECCICGRQTSGLAGAIHVAVDHERSEFVTDEQAAERGDAVSYFPVGPECVKKWRAQFGGTSVRLRMSRGEIVSYDAKRGAS